jgi:hypothetical protein
MLIELVYVRWSALRGRYRRQPADFVPDPAMADQRESAGHTAV